MQDWKERQAEMLAGVKAYALAHYNDGGWDVVVEAWEDREIAEELQRARVRSVNGAIRWFGKAAAVWADQGI
jgi:hypothetical protein